MKRDILKKSIGTNSILYTIKGVLNIAFPLITFPYASRILGVSNLGAYSFSQSIVSYIILIATLGIPTYAIREGAGNRTHIDSFANQIFTLSILTTLISYVILGISLLFFRQLNQYRLLIVILSIQVLFKTIGVEWLYSIFEDYLYITIRSIFVSMITLILLFLIVRTKDDVMNYACLTVVANSGANIISFFHARKYCKLKIVKKMDFHRHIKPILVLFAFTATVTIYVNTDMTILGIICGDRITGVYAVSSKIYAILKTILSASLTVTIPRLASYLGMGNNQDFFSLSVRTYRTYLTYVLPAIVGVIILRDEIVSIVAGEEYMDATGSLLVLSIAVFFAIAAGYWSQCILIPYKKEKIVLYITAIGAFINLVLNLFLIPIWEEKAAAFTTLLSEIFVCFACRHYAKEYIVIDKEGLLLEKVLCGCLMIVPLKILFKNIFSNQILFILMTIISSVIIYAITEICLRNDVVLKFVKDFRRVIHRT